MKDKVVWAVFEQGLDGSWKNLIRLFEKKEDAESVCGTSSFSELIVEEWEVE